MEYVQKDTNQINVSVDTEKIDIKDALRELIKIHDIDDINITNESLESIIRSIYEKN